MDTSGSDIPPSPPHLQRNLDMSPPRPAIYSPTGRTRRSSGSGGRYSGGSDGMSDLSSDMYGVGHGNSAVYNDRFIPSRSASDLEGAFDNMEVIASSQREQHGNNAYNTYNSNDNSSGTFNGMGDRNGVARESQGVMNSLLRNELLGSQSMGAVELSKFDL